MSLPTDYFFDQNLREVPNDPDALREYVMELKTSLDSPHDPKEKVRVLGEIGVWLRILGVLEEAESNLREALQIIAKSNLGIRLETQQKIRLAHVLQWKRQFDLSNALFEELLKSCRTSSDCRNYLAFALQHAGKNLFDQNRFEEALDLFDEALTVRKQDFVPADQIQSTEQAIASIKMRLGQ